MDIDNTGQTIRLIDEVPEIWVPINIQEVIGYYELSNYGRIKSKARYDLKGSFRKEKLLKWRKSRSKKKDSPYYHVCLCNGSWQARYLCTCVQETSTFVQKFIAFKHEVC